ncbi:hypothetical protein PENNAL_c0022G09100 [Penicillium nalgiovense]|uniref:Uncharacterized protein n=1 Tax=Penicillium nalgiovense TaxID=60175 RepID=A0A1V6YG17_PENNA|nr:hypothetical protein PENNAL_c0022G09100 [Penicillium nalgiovense]
MATKSKQHVDRLQSQLGGKDRQIQILTAQLAQCNKRLDPPSANCHAYHGKIKSIGGRRYQILCNQGIWATV